MKIKEKTVLYSAGRDAERFLQNAGLKDYISYIVDKNPALHGQKKEGLLIRPVETLYDEEEDVSIIVASSQYFYEIVNELRTHNLCYIFSTKEFCDEVRAEKLFQSAKDKNIILLNTPVLANIGDHMIAEAEKSFFHKFLPEYHVIEITSDVYQELHYLLENFIKKEDVIVITGGGFLGSLWVENGEDIVRDIMMKYKEQKIIVFPQSLFFEETKTGEKERERSGKIYNMCTNMTMFLREEESYKSALEIMEYEKVCRLVPDIVLSAKRSDFIKTPGKQWKCGCAICLKTCKESILDEAAKKKICHIAQKLKKDITCISMYADTNLSVDMRKKYIENKLNEISGYEVVITDTLHCMISCVLTETPCVALNNISGKVKGSYQWVKTLPYIGFANDIEDLENELERVLSCQNREYFFDYEPYKRMIVKSIER